MAEGEFRVTLKVLENEHTIFEINMTVYSKADAEKCIANWRKKSHGAIQIHLQPFKPGIGRNIKMHGIRPVKNLKQPLYPDKTIALADPALLQKLPERWANCKKAAVAAGLLTTMAVSLAACTPVKPINGSDSTTSFIANSDAISSAALSGTNSSLPAGVPLPPEIVTENDALAIIKNAADRLFANAQPYEMKDIKKTGRIYPL